MDTIFSNLRSLFIGDDSDSNISSEGDGIISNLKSLNVKNDEQPVYNPNYVPTREELLHTETLNSLLQNGGTTQIKGLRYENKLSELSSSISSISEMYGGRKNKPSASDALHQESVDYLKNDLKLSPLEARAYKSLAYRHVKEKHPDATSIERSKIMLSLVKSENFLDEFKEKLDETMKIIENIDSEKAKKSENSENSEEKTETKQKKVKKSN
jgi:hypothetical protein